MVDITRCVACGRVIPATEQGCPYCDRDRDDGEERPYLPLALRLLLVLFAVDLIALGLLGASAIARGLSGAGGGAVLLGAVRLGLAALTLAALLLRRPWGRWIPLAFIGAELVMGVLAYGGFLPPASWGGGLLPPLWTLLFLLLFLRADVQGLFDRRVLDRQEIGELIRSVQQGKRG